jgi:tetratricopeptide (TPR) repeat protein
MNDKKITDYTDLIKAIKDSPAGQEWETLNQYPDLIDQDLIKTMKQAIYVLANRGDKEEADRFVKLVIQLKDKLSEAESQVQLQLRQQWEQLNQQAISLYQQGTFTEGIDVAEQVLELARFLWGKNHPNVAISCNNLAGLYESQGRYSEAEPLYLEAVAIDRQALPPYHPFLATHLNNLAGLYESQGRYSEAEPLYLEAVAIDRQALSPNHPDLAINLNNLAGLYKSQGRYSEAEPLHLEAIAILQNSLGSQHPNTITVRNNLKTFWEVGIEAGIFDMAVLQENPLFRELLGEALESDESIQP